MLISLVLYLPFRFFLSFSIFLYRVLLHVSRSLSDLSDVRTIFLKKFNTHMRLKILISLKVLEFYPIGNLTIGSLFRTVHA